MSAMQALGGDQMSPASMDQKNLQSKHRARKQAEGSTEKMTTQLDIRIANNVMENWTIFNCLYPSSEKCDLLDFFPHTLSC